MGIMLYKFLEAYQMLQPSVALYFEESISHYHLIRWFFFSYFFFLSGENLVFTKFLKLLVRIIFCFICENVYNQRKILICKIKLANAGEVTNMFFVFVFLILI